MSNPTERFSDRVAHYIKYRPSYPHELVDALITECNLSSQSAIADVGSGTGIFSRLLLDKGFYVVAVEPNKNMRKASEQQFSGYKKFTSTDGQSERTGLDSASIDLITAAQSFHWFKRGDTKQEFARILKPGGYVALIWNQRKIDQAFQKEYDGILRKFGTDYSSVNYMNTSHEDIESFFSPHKVASFEFNNSQVLDRAGFLGRMQSSSYIPQKDTKQHAMLMQAAEDLFDRYKSRESITFDYKSVLYLAAYSS